MFRRRVRGPFILPRRRLRHRRRAQARPFADSLSSNVPARKADPARPVVQGLRAPGNAARCIRPLAQWAEARDVLWVLDQDCRLLLRVERQVVQELAVRERHRADRDSATFPVVKKKVQ